MSAADDSAPSSMDAGLQEDYRQAEKLFKSLAEDVHLPQLDVLVYTKYYINVKTPQRLEHLMVVVKALEAHRLSTLRILKLIGDREAIVDAIVQKATAFASKKLTTLEAQTSVLQLLYQHQQVTLKVVEAVLAWRDALTRPYPFQYKGANYLRKIVADCEFIDRCDLKHVLPLRVGQFPLCSNISALKMFATKGAPSASGSDGNADASHPVLGKKTPTKGKKNGTGSSTPRSRDAAGSSAPPDRNADASLTARLRAAESVLFAEQSLQVRVMKELANLANQRMFLTLLNLVDVVPNCSTGILITDQKWEAQLREWMNAALERAKQQLHVADSLLDDDHQTSSPQRKVPETKAAESPRSPVSSSHASSRSSSRSSHHSTCSAPKHTHDGGAPSDAAGASSVAEDAAKKYDDEFEDDD